MGVFQKLKVKQQKERCCLENFLQRANSPTMYLICGVVVVFVMAMAAFFMVKAWREGIRIGMDRTKMRKAVTSSLTFTIIPSIGILVGVIALSGSLGVPVPWLRLSVIGALQYETVAADVAAKGAGLTALAADQMTGSVFVSIFLVMTIGIIWGGLFCIFGLKKYQQKALKKVSDSSNKWGAILFNAMFIGMVCAFIGVAFADLRKGSIVSLVVIAVSALFMALFTWLIKKKKIQWLESFSLSFAMIFGMASAILLSFLGVK